MVDYCEKEESAAKGQLAVQEVAKRTGRDTSRTPASSRSLGDHDGGCGEHGLAPCAARSVKRPAVSVVLGRLFTFLIFVRLASRPMCTDSFHTVMEVYHLNSAVTCWELLLSW